MPCAPALTARSARAAVPAGSCSPPPSTRRPCPDSGAGAPQHTRVQTHPPTHTLSSVHGGCPNTPPPQPSIPKGSDTHPQQHPTGGRLLRRCHSVPREGGRCRDSSGDTVGTLSRRGVYSVTRRCTHGTGCTRLRGVAAGGVGGTRRLTREEATDRKRKAPAHDAIATGAGQTGMGRPRGTTLGCLAGAPGGPGWGTSPPGRAAAAAAKRRGRRRRHRQGRGG